MKINPKLEAFSFEIETTADVTLDQFANELAFHDSDVQAAFFDAFFKHLFTACDSSVHYFECQIFDLVKTMQSERKDSIFAKEWINE